VRELLIIALGLFDALLCKLPCCVSRGPAVDCAFQARSKHRVQVGLRAHGVCRRGGRTVKRILGMPFTLLLFLACSAHAFNVYDLSPRAGGSGGPLETDYEYMVTVSGGSLRLTYFVLGIDTPRVSNIVCDTPGWSGAVVGTGGVGMSTHNTPIGSVNPDGFPDHTSLDQVRWEGPDFFYGTIYFGFDSPDAPADAGWSAGPQADVIDWHSAVGAGKGPVHGPVIPEPGVVMLFVLGLSGFALYRRRRACLRPERQQGPV